MEEDLDGLVCNIRACLVSSKGPVLIWNLSRDFETLNGSPIPFKKFNHPTLESFLKSIPSLRISGSGNSLMVDAAVDSKSSHISSLVAKQKPSKRKESYNRRGGGFTSRGAGRARGYIPRGGSYRGGYSSAQKTSQYNYQPMTYSHYNSTEPLPKKSYQNNSVESVAPLYVQIDDSSDKRHVSVGETSKPLSYKESHTQRYEKPPRFQKGVQQTYDFPQLSPTQLTKDLEKKLTMEYSNAVNKNPFEKSSSDIISPLTPCKLIEAGLAKRQKQQYLIPDVSENSSVPLVPSPDEIDITNNINLLLKYVLARRWTEPEYHILPASGPKSYSKKYFATVKIVTTNDIKGQSFKKYSGYNFEDANREIAKGYAAKVALVALRKEEKVNTVKTNITSDKTLICCRISEIVADSFNGMFSKTVEEKYLEMFNERLPDDWIETLNTRPAFSVESTLNSVVILLKDPSLEQQVFHEPFPALVPLAPDLPLDQNWSVFITYATSTSEVYFRIIGENYSDRYEELLNDMTVYYKTEAIKELALSIETNQYYAVAQTAEDFLRICVNSIDEDQKTVSAWLIDNGDIETFSFSRLYRLPDQFRNLPRQAVQCSLKGLESLSEDNFTSELVATSEYLIGKPLIAEISSRPDEDNSSCLKVIFYDTSGADDINVNEKLLDIIYENAVPDLPNEGCAKEVYVGNVSKSGEVHIQIPGPKFKKITDVLETLSNEEINKYKLTNLRNVSMSKIYLAKYSKDDCWYRAIVNATATGQENKISVRFVDYGNCDTVLINDIAEVDELPSIIRKFPHQAVKVGLNNLPIETLKNTEIAKLHTLLLDDDKTILIKMVKLNEDPPIVDIFYKNDGDYNAALVSVNCTISWQRDSLRLGNAMASRTNTNTLDIFSASLKCPTFDKGAEYVAVLLSANPGNFIFQPFRFKKELDTMMHQLQTYYGATALPEVTIEEVSKGGLYAALYTDDVWYRVVVTDVVQNSSKVPVRLCDFGDIMCVPLSKLRDLEIEFRQKPFMAVKGRLAGVQPIHMDWSVEDCIRFQELVLKKALASIVVNIDQNPANPMEMVVSVNLVDGKTKKSISEILLNENRAVKET